MTLGYGNKHFVIGIDNPIDIVDNYNQAIAKEDVSAIFEHYESRNKRDLEILGETGQLYIRPDSLGRVTIRVNLKEGIKEKTLRTKSIIPVARLSKYGANHSGKISQGEFRAQAGILAIVEGYNIDAKCKAVGFEIVRVPKDEPAKKLMNQGGRFEVNSRVLISEAQAGDLYLFRNIYYRCPGDDTGKRLNDMIFEIQ